MWLIFYWKASEKIDLIRYFYIANGLVPSGMYCKSGACSLKFVVDSLSKGLVKELMFDWAKVPTQYRVVALLAILPCSRLNPKCLFQRVFYSVFFPFFHKILIVIGFFSSMGYLFLWTLLSLYLCCNDPRHRWSTFE